MRFHTQGLTAKQLRVLRSLGSVLRRRKFYLAGGTATAIYFGHRRSIDLDWFTQGPMGDALTLAAWLRDQGQPFSTGQTAPGTLHGEISGVRVSFLEFDYPMLQPFTHWPAYGGVDLASLDDLACMKLAALTQRGARKDFCDIYVLGIRHRPLEELLQLYKRKFKVRDISSVLYGLSFFDDAEEERMPKMLIDVKWKTIKNTIQDWVKEIGKS